MNRNLYILLLFILSTCAYNKDEKVVLDNESGEVKLQTEAHLDKESPPFVIYNIGEVKFHFSELTDPYELKLYQKLQISIKDSLVLEIASKTLELEAWKFGLNEKSVFNEKDRTLYVVEANNRPEPNYFIIVAKSSSSIKILGETEPLTAEYIGDIDEDGLLEIGGFNTHCQGNSIDDYNKPDFCFDHFRVYEVHSFIRRDTLAEKNILNMRQQQNKANAPIAFSH